MNATQSKKPASLADLTAGRPVLASAYARHGAVLRDGGHAAAWSDAVDCSRRVARALGITSSAAVELLRAVR